MLSDLLKPAFEKSSKENSEQILKNYQIISAYHIEVFAQKMNMNKRSAIRSLKRTRNTNSYVLSSIPH